MTALALAGADGEGVVRPDSILPPGFTGADLIPCARCGLRGHAAGDPERCLFYRGSLGLGGQAAATATAAMWRGGEGEGRRQRRRSDRGRGRVAP